jgi:hypothetical protein
VDLLAALFTGLLLVVSALLLSLLAARRARLVR